MQLNTPYTPKNVYLSIKSLYYFNEREIRRRYIILYIMDNSNNNGNYNNRVTVIVLPIVWPVVH